VAGQATPAKGANRCCENLEEVRDEAQKPALGRAGGEHVASHRVIRGLDGAPAKQRDFLERAPSFQAKNQRRAGKVARYGSSASSLRKQRASCEDRAPFMKNRKRREEKSIS
jgi:hypothetical protein